MAAWLFHRITGLAILSFLLLHIVDIFLICWGPAHFNKLLVLYTALPFRVGEVFLFAAVLFHALNGVRIILIDFQPALTERQEVLFWMEVGAFVVLFIPVAILMLGPLSTGRG